MQSKPKKKGRAVTENSVYYRESLAKVEDWKRILANGRWDTGKYLTRKDKDVL